MTDKNFDVREENSGLVRLFSTELVRFTKQNYWVYPLYITLLLITFFSESGDILEVSIISTLHFISDMFIMMMISSYLAEKHAQGTVFQITAFLIFFSIKLYTAKFYNDWHYLLTDPIYFLVAVKSWFKDVKKTDIKWINPLVLTSLSLLIVLFTMNYEGENKSIWFHPKGKAIQSIGIFLFAISLSITKNLFWKTWVGIVSLGLMSIGSAFMFYFAVYRPGQSINGLEISYFLLPLTVMFYYIAKRPKKK